MLIVCPNCATSYQVEPSSLGATGRSVRCVRCKKVWFASNTSAMAAIALSHHRDMAALSGVPMAAGAMDGAMDPLDRPLTGALDEPYDEPPQEEPAEIYDRDDRGPGPLPEPRDYDLPVPPVVDDAPALAPGDPGSEPQAAIEPAIEAIPENIETVAARRIRKPPRRQRSGWPMSGWAVAIAVLLAVNIGLVAFRADIVRLFPQTASAYAAAGFDVNLRGLVFTDLVTRKDNRDGASMLVVEGVIKSTSKRDTPVPRLRFAIRNTKGQEIYTWTAQPDRNTIAPGATIPFRTRLASPPSEAHAVLVRFFNRRDLTAGLQ